MAYDRNQRGNKAFNFAVAWRGILIAIFVVFMAAGAAAQEPVRGGVLRVGQTTDILPTPHDLGRPDGPFKWQVFDTLVRLNPENLDPEPQLAESWEFSEDFLTLTFKIRPGVLFHNGEELTSEAVAANLRHVQDAATGSRLRGRSLAITSIETPDSSTLVLGFDAPNPLVLDFFNQLWIGAPSSLGNASESVGTGPFERVEWIPGTRVRLERFEDYWQEGLPYLDAVEIIILPDDETLIANLQAGAVDFIRDVPLTSFEALRADPRFEVVTSDRGSIFYAIGLVTDSAPLDNKLVRQALSRSMNRERFVRVFLQEAGEATCVPWPRQSPAYDEAQANACAYDLEEARRLLEEAGFGDGFEFTIQVTRSLSPDTIRFVQMWQQDLAQIGVQMNIEEIQQAVWQENKNNALFTEAWGDVFGNSNRDPAVLFLEAITFVPDRNPSRFSSPEYDALIEQLASEMDVERRNEIIHQLTDILLDEAFVNVLTYQPRIWAYTDRLNNVQWTQADHDLFEAAWLAQ